MKTLFAYLRTFFALVIIFVNLLILPVIVILLAFIEKILPVKFLKNILHPLSHKILPNFWVSINSLAMDVASSTKWEINNNGELSTEGWYFLMCNHQSWLDILVLQRIFVGKIPMLKFFMKQELLWTLPIGGLACYMLDFPFMKRHSKEYLKKHPEQRDKDVETTRRSCEKFKHQPITMMNYVEGTRFTEQKRRARNSPYRHLLPPKAGGIAFVLATMDKQIGHIIDTTIIYHGGKSGLWAYFTGHIHKVTIYSEVIEVPEKLRGDYYHDKDFRVTFQQWLNQRWQQKDEHIDQTLKASS